MTTTDAATPDTASAASLVATADMWDTPLGEDGTPYAYFEALRDELETSRIGWSEAHGGFWICGGYDESVQIMADTESFSNTQVTLPQYETGRIPLMMSEHDDPEHKKYRMLVAGAFSPGKARAYSDRLREVVDVLIDGFIGDGKADVAVQLADEVPTQLTAILLGLGPEWGDTLRGWMEAVTHLQVTDPEKSLRLTAESRDFARKLIAERRGTDATDVFSTVVNAQIDGVALTDDELIGFFTVLLIGGIDNSSRFLSTILWRLAWDIELRRTLIQRPQILGSAIDELFRVYGPAIVGRKVVKEVTIGDVTMHPGQFVMMWHSVANRDRKAFPHPDTLIPDRAPNRHLSLGNGIHRCIGMHLARVEMTISISEFLKRIPAFRLDLDQRPEWMCGQVSGFRRVPIIFPTR